MSATKQFFTSFKLNRNLTIFLVCVVMATLFWLLNALSKSYVVAISVPLNYQGVPENGIITNSPTKQVQVRVEGEGYSLLGVGDDQHSPANIDLSELFSRNLNKPERATVNTKYLQRQIQEEVGSAIKILGISHDSVRIDIEPTSIKTVPVQAKVLARAKSGYVISKVQTFPEFVEVSGPQSIIDTLSQLVAMYNTNLELENTENLEVKLAAPKLISANPKTVDLEIEVEQLTQGSFKVPVHVLNVPDSLQVNLYPEEVEVSFSTSLSNFDSVSIHDFRAIVNFENSQSNQLKLLPVRVYGPDEDVHLLNYEPKKLEYIIRRL